MGWASHPVRADPGRDRRTGMGTRGTGVSPKPTRAGIAVDLVDRLDVLHVLLGENADRLLLSPGGAVTVRVLGERAALQRERDDVEFELRRRMLPDGPQDLDPEHDE